jgi:RNA polymerase sigma-70 factor (ECF subfamily)
MGREVADGRLALGREALTHADDLFRFAYYLSRSSASAEDLVQDTFARALSSSAQFQRGTNLKAWLLRILRNVFIDGKRRAQHDPTHAATEETEGAADEKSLLRGDIELEQLRRVVAEDIEDALFALPEEGRTVILLDLEGMTEGEIASVMGCAVGTVKSRLSRARAHLRERLKEYAR